MQHQTQVWYRSLLKYLSNYPSAFAKTAWRTSSILINFHQSIKLARGGRIMAALQLLNS
jgi:hypothetical protein